MIFLQIWLFLISQCSGKSVKKCGLNERLDCGNLKACERKCNEEESEEEIEAVGAVKSIRNSGSPGPCKHLNSSVNFNILKRCLSRDCLGRVCMCDYGFYRNKDGECVTEDDCEYDNMEIITFPPGEN
ncbi:hypothetical protein Y032_0907g2980 [Ancylostoma ceylanicum]|uniref:TIL domain-containing protein n=1 Tax=Ancylostoma ceylanicum TaxID=53326 RepID=A0A016W9Q3_9BILA|nr:hypothetical protein Y032_0907g2980 [Ancylostoma ceylanicum]